MSSWLIKCVCVCDWMWFAWMWLSSEKLQEAWSAMKENSQVNGSLKKTLKSRFWVRNLDHLDENCRVFFVQNMIFAQPKSQTWIFFWGELYFLSGEENVWFAPFGWVRYRMSLDFFHTAREVINRVIKSLRWMQLYVLSCKSIFGCDVDVEKLDCVLDYALLFWLLNFA